MLAPVLLLHRPTTQTMRKNLLTIQFLRFVAAMLVAYLHTAQAIEGRHPGGVSEAYLHVVGIGAAGVHIFFVISGFVMVYTSFGSRSAPLSVSTFVLRRFIRIYPIYWVYCALYVLLACVLTKRWELTVPELFASLLLLPGHASHIIGPGWSLSYEVYFYLCFALALLCCASARAVVFAMSAYLAASIAVGAWVDASHPAVHMLTNPLLAEFVLGAFIALFALRQPHVTNAQANALVLAGLAGFLAGALVDYTRLPTAVIWGVPSAMLIGGLVLHELNGRRFRIVERLAWLGDSSYSFYLLHIALIQLLLVKSASKLGRAPVLLSLAISCLCCLASVLAYRLIERRLVSGLQAWSSRWQRRPELAEAHTIHPRSSSDL